MPELKFALTRANRLRGLLFKQPDQTVLLLAPCHDVHTFGMRYAIDIAFLDSNGVVVESCRDVLPRKRKRCKKAYATLERFSNPRLAWVQVGDTLRIEEF